VLRTLSIRNFALIDRLEIDFGPGLNILTGETGAGKSILIGALELALGARASSDAVRSGARRADVQAVFSLDRASPDFTHVLERYGVEIEGDEIILARTVSAEGRSKAYAAGQLVPVSALSEIAAELVDLHGQHEHQSLLRADHQLALVDAFAGLTESRTEMAARVRALRSAEAEIRALGEDGRETERRLEFLRFEAGEIDRAKPRPGEDDQLKERRALLANSERIWTNVAQARNRIADSDAGDSAMGALSAALAALEQIATYHPDLAGLTDRLRAAITEVESVAYDLLPFGEQENFDPQELDSLNTRLAQLRELKRKYGESIDHVLAYREKIEGDIAALADRDQVLARLRQTQSKIEADCREHAAILTNDRCAAAKRFDRQVTQSLQQLGMEGARLTLEISDAPLSASGVDRVEFLIAANPGEPPKALRNVASGGELSRVMLALKSVFARGDGVPTLVFDEIDAGIGGQVATRVAQRLRDLAESHQVLCITHLAQIAAAGQHHFHVAKTVRDGVTTTQVIRVESKSRVEEVARLLDGSVTNVSLTHAEDLLKKLAG
jgi:DNA repair protein RecN (Recombination protein N)